VYCALMSLHRNCGFFLFVSVRMRTSGAFVSCIMHRMSATAFVLPRMFMHAILTTSSRSLPVWAGAGLQGVGRSEDGIGLSLWLLSIWADGSRRVGSWGGGSAGTGTFSYAGVVVVVGEQGVCGWFCVVWGACSDLLCRYEVINLCPYSDVRPMMRLAACLCTLAVTVWADVIFCCLAIAVGYPIWFDVFSIVCAGGAGAVHGARALWCGSAQGAGGSGRSFSLAAIVGALGVGPCARPFISRFVALVLLVGGRAASTLLACPLAEHAIGTKWSRFRSGPVVLPL
jgi:hypothetical protein